MYTNKPDCPQCDKLRRKLSPLEDRKFTALYVANEPIEYIRSNKCMRDGKAAYKVSLPSLYKQAFDGRSPTAAQLTALGRTLSALLWERTKNEGNLYFVISVSEFNEAHN